MKIHLKLFLAMGIPFGIVMGIFFSFKHGISSGMVDGVSSGLFVGGFMSLMLGFMHRRSVKRISSETSEEALGVHHVRKVKLQLTYDKVFDLCMASLSLIKKCKIQNEDRSQGKIVAKVGMTWKTWGDVISFEVREIDNDGVQVEVSSRPSVRTTLVDYGKNLENVKTLVGYINANSESK